MNDIMIDLETLSLEANAAILTIGAVAFDLDTMTIEPDTFYTGIRMEQTPDDHVDPFIKYGHIDPVTVKWWLQQSDAARDQVIAMTDHGADLFTVLVSLAHFINANSGQTSPRIWSNGTSFDLPILRSAYKRCILETPWDYRNERDTRTIIDLGQRLAGYDARTLPRHGIAHRALDDAQYQAEQMIAVYRELLT